MAPRGRGTGLRAQATRLTEVIEPVANHVGFDLEHVSVSRVGRRHLVRVIIDSDSGVDLDGIAEVSRSVSVALDAAEQAGSVLVAGEYVLEVSSPGVDRPLAQPRHWRRNRGRLVSVTVSEHGTTGQLTGRIVDADDEQVVLEVDGTARTFSYGQLGSGRVQVELRRLEEEAPGEGEPT
jgi:ribosome maturation factor RimP